MTAKKNPQPGVTNYRRPSAAIERGGGFFVPGLEGFRLRFVLAAVILGLLSLDGFSRPGMTTSQVVSEVLAGLAGISLLVQALVDQQLERAVETRREAMAAAAASEGGQVAGVTPREEVAFFDSAALGGELEAKVMWAADILLQLTAACSFVLVSDGKVLARVGATGGESDATSSIAAAFERATAAATPTATTGERDQGSTSAIIVKSSDGDSVDIALMRLLPSECRQGILCKISSPPGSGGGGGGGGGGDLVVLLGSTLRGSGAFAGMDRGWFERVCALLALTPAAAADAGGR